MNELSRTIDRLSRLFGGGFVSTEVRAGANPVDKPSGSQSRYRVALEKHGMVLDVDLPGIDPKDVTLWVTNAHVIVKAPGRGGSGVQTHRYTLSADYDPRTASATMADGQLRVRIVRTAAVEPKRVPIEHATKR